MANAVKTISGVAQADIGKLNGLAIASIRSIGGLDNVVNKTAHFSDFIKGYGDGAITETNGVLTYTQVTSDTTTFYTDVNYGDNAYVQWEVTSNRALYFQVGFRESHIITDFDTRYGTNNDTAVPYDPSVTDFYLGHITDKSLSWDANASWTLADGDIIRIEINGTSMVGKKNGTTIVSKTTTHTNGSYWWFSSGGNSWEIKDLEFGQL